MYWSIPVEWMHDIAHLNIHVKITFSKLNEIILR